jgi:hypothetical protein
MCTPVPCTPSTPSPGPGPGPRQAGPLRRGLVCAAAARLSGPHACAQRDRAPSGPPVLGTLASQCSDLDALAAHLHALLARLMPKGLGKRGRRGAVDVGALPSHGTVAEAPRNEVCRSTAKGGTPPVFPYATASAVVRGRRYTLARCRVRAKQRMDQVLRPRLIRLAPMGSRLNLLWLARGFYSERVRRALITAEWPCSMPAVKRGTPPTPPGGPTGTSALAAEKHSRWTRYTLRARQRGRLTLTWPWSVTTRGATEDVPSARPCSLPPGVARIGPCGGCAPPIGGMLAWRRPPGKRIQRVFAPAAAPQPGGGCAWGWR